MKIAERRAALAQGPVFLYYFRWESPLQGGRFKSPHTIEIPFAFDNIKRAALTKDSPTAQALADKVSASWLAFARSGNPSVSQLPPWTPFNGRERATMVFDNESRVVNDPIREQRLAMLERAGPRVAGSRQSEQALFRRPARRFRTTSRRTPDGRRPASPCARWRHGPTSWTGSR